MNYDRTAQNHEIATFSCVTKCFYFVLWERFAGGSVQSNKEWSLFSIFCRLGRYPQVFGQVKEWLILGLREMIRMLHAVACAMDFNLLRDWGQQGGVLKLQKNDHFQVLLTVWILFLKFLHSLRSDIYWNSMKWYHI